MIPTERRAKEGVDELRRRASEVPSSDEEGWLRRQEDIAKPPFEGADGVVLIKKMNHLNEPPRPRQLRWLRSFRLMARPPLLRQGGDLARLSIHSNLLQLATTYVPRVGMIFAP